MKCRTCGDSLSDMWFFVTGLTRCYSCLDEERVALKDTEEKVQQRQRARTERVL